MPIQIEEIIENMDMASPTDSLWLDTKEGKVLVIPDSPDIDMEGPVEELPEWQRELRAEIEAVRENLDNRFMQLPDSFEIHEWQMMKDFCNTVKNQGFANDLSHSLHGGPGAFRRFRDRLRTNKLEDQWFDYKSEHLKELAIEWCKENNIQFTV